MEISDSVAVAYGNITLLCVLNQMVKPYKYRLFFIDDCLDFFWFCFSRERISSASLKVCSLLSTLNNLQKFKHIKCPSFQRVFTFYESDGLKITDRAFLLLLRKLSCCREAPRQARIRPHRVSCNPCRDVQRRRRHRPQSRVHKFLRR